MKKLGKPWKLEYGKIIFLEKFSQSSQVQKGGGVKIRHNVDKVPKLHRGGVGGQQMLGIFPKFYNVGVLKASLSTAHSYSAAFPGHSPTSYC